MGEYEFELNSIESPTVLGRVLRGLSGNLKWEQSSHSSEYSTSEYSTTS